MKSAALVVAMGVLAAMVVAKPQGQSRLDTVNVAEIVKNDRLLTNYIRCMLDDNDSRCTAEGKDLKKEIPRIVSSGCGDCTDSQRANAELVLKKITKDRPQDWQKLKAKFDPTGESSKRHGDYWKSKGINI